MSRVHNLSFHCHFIVAARCLVGSVALATEGGKFRGSPQAFFGKTPASMQTLLPDGEHRPLPEERACRSIAAQRAPLRHPPSQLFRLPSEELPCRLPARAVHSPIDQRKLNLPRPQDGEQRVIALSFDCPGPLSAEPQPLGCPILNLEQREGKGGTVRQTPRALGASVQTASPNGSRSTPDSCSPASVCAPSAHTCPSAAAA